MDTGVTPPARSPPSAFCWRRSRGHSRFVHTPSPPPVLCLHGVPLPGARGVQRPRLRGPLVRRDAELGGPLKDGPEPPQDSHGNHRLLVAPAWDAAAAAAAIVAATSVSITFGA